MLTTDDHNSAEDTPRAPRPRWRPIAIGAVAVGVIGVGVAYIFGSSRVSRFASTSSAYAFPQTVLGSSPYTYMMGGSTNSASPQSGWSYGDMMGLGSDPGKAMGQYFENAPGPRVNSTDAAKLGQQIPNNATIDRSKNQITFTSEDVSLTLLASPSGGPDEAFKAAGLVNPTIMVPSGAKVGLNIINADSDTAHGLVVTSSTNVLSSWMTMMTSAPAFSGSALWFLGNATSKGMHEGTFSFIASQAGSYKYLCPVPGHAQEGMVGNFVVQPTV